MDEVFFITVIEEHMDELAWYEQHSRPLGQCFLPIKPSKREKKVPHLWISNCFPSTMYTKTKKPITKGILYMIKKALFMEEKGHVRLCTRSSRF